MSITSKVLAIAAVAALTAATAVPAMALENEFHGMFSVRGYDSNYLSGTAGALKIGSDSTATKNWIEQRARLFYSAKANDNLKLVTGFELDDYWGDTSYATGRNHGGALGADSVSLETKWVYLDFNDPFIGANFKAGLQGLNDDYKGLIVGAGADAAGIQVSKAVGPFTGTFGWFRLDDRNTATANQTATGDVAGAVTRDLLMASGKVAVTKDIKVGGSYYYLSNNGVGAQTATAAGAVNQVGAGTASGELASGNYNVHILGVNAAANFGPVSLDAFGIYEFGRVVTTLASGAVADAHVNAFAGNLGAKIKAGPGSVKLAALYVSGNSSTDFGGNGFVCVNNTTSSVYTENGSSAIGNLWLLVRNPKETTNEQSIIADSGNLNQGIIGGSVGYDMAINKLFANANVGVAATAKKANNTNSFIGTELNAEIGYKLYDNMSALVRGAYVVLGDHYNNKGIGGTDPANPYETQLVLSYTF
jgi:hypothetical protein